MITTVKSPVNRMGGKYFLTDWLSQHIPEHVCYVEPFCGAGHLLFSKSPSQVEVLNDTDNHLISFFRAIQHPETRPALVDRLDYMPYSRSLWNEIRSQWKAGILPQDEIERVSQWFYLNRTCFSGDQKRGGFAMPSTTGRNPVQSYYNAIDSLNIVAKRLKNVCIENLPYDEVISRYDSEDTLFYADPPYLGVGHYYGDSFSQEDHHRLSELLHGIKGQVMVSHYPDSLYNDLYKDWNKYTYQSFKGSHKAGPGTEKPVTMECLYTNFEPVKTRGLFDAME